MTDNTISEWDTELPTPDPGLMSALASVITPDGRSALQRKFINHLIDDMEVKTMLDYMFQSLDEAYDEMPTSELITEITQYYPELIDENIGH